MRGRTLRSSFRLEGIAVHSGRPCAATVEPGVDLRFVVGGVEIPATPGNVLATTLSTTLGAHGATVSTVEHLLSALWGLGVTGARVEVEGPELPILDGSALPWVHAIEAAGLVDVGVVEPIVIDRPIVVRAGERVARCDPGPQRVVVDLTDRRLLPLGPPRVQLDSPARYVLDVAWARTFAYAEDVERLLAAGHGAGATRENTVVVGAEGTIPRGPSEPSRHKLLDALGDLALLGRTVLGTITLVDSGHALHVELARRIAERHPRR